MFRGELLLSGYSSNKNDGTIPLPSMYGIFTYIWLFLMVKYGFHVSKYTSPMDDMG